MVAVVAAASFFASILLHELGHALAARREGIAVDGIDLFLFGGVMKMSRETDSPGAEFRVAVAGPLVTLAIMALAAGAAILLAGADSFWDAARLSAAADATPVEVVVSLLVSMNLVLLLFNLVPAFPLDGGRIARAAAWKLTGDRHRATRFAARIGIGFGWLLDRARATAGRRSAPARRSTRSGSPRSAGCSRPRRARRCAQTAFTEQLAGITVADVMDAEPVTIPAGLPAARAYEDYFLRYQGWEWFAVVERRRALRRHRAPARGRARRAARRAARRRCATSPLRAPPRRRCGPTRRWRRCWRPSRCGGWAR